VTMRRLVAAELMKLRTTTSWWYYVAGFAVLEAGVLTNNWFSQHYQLHPQADLPDRAQALAQAAQARTPSGVAAIAASMMTSGDIVLVLLAILVGIHIAANEFAQRTATATFLTIPRRGRVVAAKMAAAACVGVLLWLTATVLDGVGTVVFLRTEHLGGGLLGVTTVRSAGMGLLAFVLSAVFGAGLGTLIRSQLAAVIVAIASYAGGLALVELVSQLAYYYSKEDWVLGLPVAALPLAIDVMISPGRGFSHAPPHWAGVAVLAGYALVLAAAGTAAIRARDI
jgi:ABC-2 type transport system permease protein